LSAGQFSFGLSISIEAMTWSTWFYLAENWRSVLTGKLSTFGAMAAGYPSAVFFDWLIRYVRYYLLLDGHSLALAAGHVWTGGLWALFLVLSVYRHRLDKISPTRLMHCMRSRLAGR
jgi:hypothetical protein